jgi:CheY-like chemotaxis protein
MHMKILLADDSPYIRAALARLFTHHKIEVVEAATGREALDKLQTESVALVISDLDMPEMNGIELAKHVRANHPDLPLLAFTGSSGNYIREQAGFVFDKVFNKPKDSALLVKEAINLLSKAKETTISIPSV